jgi:pimeloyl-ACP methyl ester carboxylesterase
MALSVRVSGDGDPVVLHPSLGRPAADFDDLVDRLVAAGHRCVAVDPRGVGASDSLLGPGATLHDLAADVLEVMDGLGIAPAHLVGHALGNRVVRTLGADAPHRVRSVVLLAAGGQVEGDTEARAALLSCFDRSLGEAEHLTAVRTAFFAPGSAVPDAWRTGWHPAAAAAQGGAVGRTPPADYWPDGSAPLLVVQGVQDRIAPPENGRLLRDECGAELVEVDGAGHALLPERPEEVGAAVVSFLGRLSP